MVGHPYSMQHGSRFDNFRPAYRCQCATSETVVCSISSPQCQSHILFNSYIPYSSLAAGRLPHGVAVARHPGDDWPRRLNSGNFQLPGNSGSESGMPLLLPAERAGSVTTTGGIGRIDTAWYTPLQRDWPMTSDSRSTAIVMGCAVNSPNSESDRAASEKADEGEVDILAKATEGLFSPGDHYMTEDTDEADMQQSLGGHSDVGDTYQWQMYTSIDQSLCGPSDMGFVDGRSYVEHVQESSKEFYASVVFTPGGNFATPSEHHGEVVGVLPEDGVGGTEPADVEEMRMENVGVDTAAVSGSALINSVNEATNGTCSQQCLRSNDTVSEGRTDKDLDQVDGVEVHQGSTSVDVADPSSDKIIFGEGDLFDMVDKVERMRSSDGVLGRRRRRRRSALVASKRVRRALRSDDGCSSGLDDGVVYHVPECGGNQLGSEVVANLELGCEPRDCDGERCCLRHEGAGSDEVVSNFEAEEVDQTRSCETHVTSGLVLPTDATAETSSRRMTSDMDMEVDADGDDASPSQTLAVAVDAKDSNTDILTSAEVVVDPTTTDGDSLGVIPAQAEVGSAVPAADSDGVTRMQSDACLVLPPCDVTALTDAVSSEAEPCHDVTVAESNGLAASQTEARFVVTASNGCDCVTAVMSVNRSHVTPYKAKVCCNETAGDSFGDVTAGDARHASAVSQAEVSAADSVTTSLAAAVCTAGEGNVATSNNATTNSRVTLYEVAVCPRVTTHGGCVACSEADTCSGLTFADNGDGVTTSDDGPLFAIVTTSESCHVKSKSFCDMTNSEIAKPSEDGPFVAVTLDDSSHVTSFPGFTTSESSSCVASRERTVCSDVTPSDKSKIGPLEAKVTPGGSRPVTSPSEAELCLDTESDTTCEGAPCPNETADTITCVPSLPVDETVVVSDDDSYSPAQNDWASCSAPSKCLLFDGGETRPEISASGISAAAGSRNCFDFLIGLTSQPAAQPDLCHAGESGAVAVNGFSVGNSQSSSVTSHYRRFLKKLPKPRFYK